MGNDVALLALDLPFNFCQIAKDNGHDGLGVDDKKSVEIPGVTDVEESVSTIRNQSRFQECSNKGKEFF